MTHPCLRLRALPNRLGITFAALCALFAISSPASAEPQCAFGQGADCDSEYDCAGNPDATLCVLDINGDGTCQVPCMSDEREADIGRCTVGESCVSGTDAVAGAGHAYYCKPSGFSMDLNMLDACIYHFLEGMAPDLSDESTCSIVANLNRMMDQDGNGRFNIFDVDACVNTFLGEESCDLDTESCPDGQTFCDDTNPCGVGLFCNPDLNKCTRECGTVVNREGGNLVKTLDRPCSGRLKSCQYESGSCVNVDPTETSCEADHQCPSGAYCHLGECASKCYRSLDCPGNDWYCSSRNQCQPRPLPPADDEGIPFDPTAHSVQFAVRTVTLDPIQDSRPVPLVIMNLVSRKQVFEQPNAVFGYRIQLTEYTKVDQKCQVDFDSLRSECGIDTDCKDSVGLLQADCTIEDHEQFLIPENPFGIIYGVGQPSIGLSLDTAITSQLSAGTYQATLTATFTNGSRTSVPVYYHKASPSGQYLAQLGVFHRDPASRLGGTAVGMHLEFNFGDGGPGQDHIVEWDELLREHNVSEEKLYTDLTEGFRVEGYIDGADSMLFDWPSARSRYENRIPVVGIYAQEYRQLRLLAVVDYPAEYCRDELGQACVTSNGSVSGDGAMVAQNLFGRTIRRLIEFGGEYDDRTNRARGIYRETYEGLTPYGDFTLDGRFTLTQLVQDESPIELEELLKATGGKLLAAGTEMPVFPGGNRARSSAGGDRGAGEGGATGSGGAGGAGGSAGSGGSGADAPEVDLEIIRTLLDDEIDAACVAQTAVPGRATQADFEYARTAFDGGDDGYDGTAFRNYLGQIAASPIFANTLVMGSLVGEAVTALDTKKAADPNRVEVGNAYLTLDDYLRDKINFCGTGEFGIPEDSGACVDESTLRCGLALYRKAIILQWADQGRLGAGWTGTEELFCEDLPTAGSYTGSGVQAGGGCSISASKDPALVTLQEHNRFYRELIQTHRFQAGGAVRDAFITLFRAEDGGELSEATAYAYKEKRLRDAIRSYDAVLAEVFRTTGSAVLFNWPMEYFATRGQVWVKQMHSTVSERMEAVLELTDLRRRVLLEKGKGDEIFIHHLLHQEYLQQVMLMALQSQWQGPSYFKYSGQAEELLEQGDRLLTLVGDTRNPFGLNPDRIYFENGDLGKANWQNYRAVVQSEMGQLHQEVTSAVDNLRGSLAGQANFTQSLRGESHRLEETLDSICGPDEDIPTACDLGGAELKVATECSGPDCLFNFVCEAAGCETVVQAYVDDFNEAVDGATSVACRSDVTAANTAIPYNGEVRQCVRGQVGTLLQERVALRLQRRHVSERVRSGVRRMSSHVNFMLAQDVQDAARAAAIVAFHAEMEAIATGTVVSDAAIDVAQTAADVANEAAVKADNLDCILVGGSATGTDCPQHVAAVEAREKAKEAEEAVADARASAKKKRDTIVKKAQDALVLARQLAEAGFAHLSRTRAEQIALENMAAEITNHIASFESVTQQLFNIEIRIQDALYMAKQASERHDQQIEDIVGALTGSEAGNVLKSNAKVMAANERFRRILIEVYKMTRAFIHRYNIDGRASNLTNRVYEIVTLDDLQQFLDDMQLLEREYCGSEGLDCDYQNNGQVFEFSVQQQLYPNLRDIVDPNSGKVLTVGQQFHNILMSNSHMRRRARPYGISDQAEINFSIWANDRGPNSGAPQRFMLSAGDCNHIITSPARSGTSEGGNGVSGGTVAVNVVGTRLPNSPGVTFELVRGNVDQIRSCTEQRADRNYESEINTYIVGWAPHSQMARQDEGAEFFTRSGELDACINNFQLNDPRTVDAQEGCFSFFARDRSLAAPDYQLIIPQLDGDQDWLIGEGIPADERPIIEDVVLYFRYNDRPIVLQ